VDDNIDGDAKLELKDLRTGAPTWWVLGKILLKEF
jgi:hypothetical protein